MSPDRKISRPENSNLSVLDSESEDEDDDEEGDRCPICLLRLRLQPVGRPQPCQHLFCLVCIMEWAKVTPSCPIDRIAFSSVGVREQLGEEESGKAEVPKKKINKEQEVVEVVEDEEQTLCEECRRGDREHLLLLCDGCDLATHTTCLNPPLAEVPLGSWYCPVCRAAGLGDDEQAERLGPAEVQARLERTGRTRGRLGTRTRGRRGEIVRTGHLERIRMAVNDVVSQLGSASKRKRGKSRKPKGGRKRRPGGRKKKCSSSKSKENFKERRTDSAMLDNVKAALGIAAPATHWSEVQSSETFSLFGSAAAFDPMGSEGEEDEEDSPSFPTAGGGPSTRVMPRHLAVERLALARRRRNKVSIAPPVASVSSTSDLLSGIMSGQMGLLAPKKPALPKMDGRYLAPKVRKRVRQNIFQEKT